MRTARMVLTPWLCKKSMISRICFASCHACAIRSWRFGPIPSTECNSDGRLSMTTRISAPKCSTSFLARIGPMPFTRPLPRYRSIPSVVVGGTVFRIVALNCRPCSLSLTHQPLAVSHSPAVTDGSEPTTVTSSRCPFAFTRRTQKPLSSLWKVTRSIKPEICSVEGWRSGVAESMRGLHFAMVGVLGRQARTRLAAHPRNAAGNGRINHCAPEAITDGDNPLGMVRVRSDAGARARQRRAVALEIHRRCQCKFRRKPDHCEHEQYTAADIASLKAKLAQYPSGTELQLNISGSPQQVALVHGAIEAVASEHRFEIGQPEPTN